MEERQVNRRELLKSVVPVAFSGRLFVWEPQNYYSLFLNTNAVDVEAFMKTGEAPNVHIHWRTVPLDEDFGQAVRAFEVEGCKESR